VAIIRIVGATEFTREVVVEYGSLELGPTKGTVIMIH
jgi:hypothetical protein